MNTNTITRFIIALPIIWLFTGFLFVHGSDKIIVPLTMLSISVSIWKYRCSLAKYNIKNFILTVIMSTLIYGSLSYITHGFSSNEIRALLVSFLFFTFSPKNIINKKQLSYLINLSSVITLIYLSYQSLILEVHRASYPFNPIPYSFILSVYATYCLYAFVYEKNKLMLLPYCLLTIGIFLTETRGAILALFLSSAFILLYQIYLSSKKINKKHLVKYLMLSIFISSSIAYLINDPLINRYNETVSEVQSIQSGNLDTSIGIRLQLWKAAVDISKEKLIVGVGDYHLDYLKKLYDNGVISKTLVDFSPNHYHNQYLDKLVKTGVIGLILLILLQVSLLVSLDLQSTTTKALAISLTITFIASSLTDTPFGQGISLLTTTMFMNIIFNLYSSNDGSVETLQKT